MSYRIEFLESAALDLVALHEWIDDAAGAAIADAYLARLQAKCLTLLDFPNRGTPRDDLAAGVRSVSFERRISVFYRVEDDAVLILRVVSAAREGITVN